MRVTASPDATSSRNGQDVARHEGDVRLESGRKAGAVDQAVARRRRPGVTRELLEVDRLSTREAVKRGKRRHHRLLEEIVALNVLVVAPWRGGVLKEEGEVERAVAHGCDEVLHRALGDSDLELWLGGPHPSTMTSGTIVAMALGNAPTARCRRSSPTRAPSCSVARRKRPETASACCSR